MHIQIVTVGKMKSGFAYLQPGIDDYLKRLKAYARVALVEVPDEPIRPSVTDLQVMEKEAQRILPHIERSAYAVAFTERGEALTSEQFSRALFARLDANPPNGGIGPGDPGPMIFIVGGPLGLHPEVLRRCQWSLSLSSMTFPHPLVRLILLEQLYRAFKIQRKEPYHK